MRFSNIYSVLLPLSHLFLHQFCSPAKHPGFTPEIVSVVLNSVIASITVLESLKGVKTSWYTPVFHPKAVGGYSRLLGIERRAKRVFPIAKWRPDVHAPRGWSFASSVTLVRTVMYLSTVLIGSPSIRDILYRCLPPTGRR